MVSFSDSFWIRRYVQMSTILVDDLQIQLNVFSIKLSRFDLLPNEALMISIIQMASGYIDGIWYL
jgi:hypothetical protein